MLEAQTGAPFSLATLNGTFVYNTIPASTLATLDASGAFTADGAGHTTSLLDENVGVGTINVLQLGVDGHRQLTRWRPQPAPYDPAQVGEYTLSDGTTIYAINSGPFRPPEPNSTEHFAVHRAVVLANGHRQPGESLHRERNGSHALYLDCPRSSSPRNPTCERASGGSEPHPVRSAVHRCTRLPVHPSQRTARKSATASAPTAGFAEGAYAFRYWLRAAAEVTGSQASNIGPLGQNLTLLTYTAGPQVALHIGRH